MKGSVTKYQTKAGTRWRIVYDLPPDPETGERRQTTKRGFATEKAADRALRKILGAVEEDSYVAPDRITVADYLRRWLEGWQGRETTRARYRQSIDCHLIPHLGGIRLQALTADDLDRCYRSLERSGGRGGRPLKPKTVRNAHGTLRTALEDAVRRRYIIRNVADDARPPKIQDTELVIWTATQVRRFLAHVRDDRLYALWIMLSTTGMRRGESLGLRWEDVDLDAGKVRIHRQLTVVDGRPTFAEHPKSKKSRRTLALDVQTIQALRDHRKRQMSERMAAGPAWQETGLVFTFEDGRLIHPQNPTKWLGKYAAALGLPHGGPHLLRHTYATLALRAGVPLRVVSERLGHANVSITLSTYTHVLADDDAEAAEQAAAAILG